jgi:mannitol-1-/sugar-/sorbitol-6-phosphatase
VNQQINVRAVLLDMDGVLADSECVVLQAWEAELREASVGLDVNTLRPLLRGIMDHANILAALAKHTSPSRAEVIFRAAMERYLVDAAIHSRPTPGAMNLLARLQQTGVPVALVTSASRQIMHTVMTTLGMVSYFTHMVADDDVINRKPDPEVFLLAASLLGVKTRRCLLVEDSPHAIATAKSIGMTCVGLATTYAPDLLANADFVISSLDDFPWSKIMIG